MAEKEEKETKGRSKLLWIVVALLVVLIAGTGTGLGFLYMRKTPKAEEPPKEEPIRCAVSLDPFLVNLADKDEVRFVKATFRLGFTDLKALEHLGKNPVFIAASRDAIISLLTSKTADEMLSPEGKSKLREEIESRINGVQPEAHVKEVYIVDFVVQL